MGLVAVAPSAVELPGIVPKHKGASDGDQGEMGLFGSLLAGSLPVAADGMSLAAAGAGEAGEGSGPASASGGAAAGAGVPLTGMPASAQVPMNSAEGASLVAGTGGEAASNIEREANPAEAAGDGDEAGATGGPRKSLASALAAVSGAGEVVAMDSDGLVGHAPGKGLSAESAESPAAGESGATTGIDAEADVQPEPPPETDAPPDGEAPDRVVRTVGNANETGETVDVADQHHAPRTDSPAQGGSNSSDPGASRLLDTQAAQTTQPTQHGQQMQPASAGQAAAHAQRPVPQAPVEQLVNAVIERVNGDGGDARLTLDPPDLGEVLLRIHARGEHVRVEVLVERPEVLAMLRNGSPSLQALLADRGLDLGDATFQLGTFSGGGAEDRDQQPGGGDGTAFAGILGVDAPDGAAGRRFQQLRAAYNPDGDLLYRV